MNFKTFSIVVLVIWIAGFAIYTLGGFGDQNEWTGFHEPKKPSPGMRSQVQRSAIKVLETEAFELISTGSEVDTLVVRAKFAKEPVTFRLDVERPYVEVIIQDGEPNQVLHIAIEGREPTKLIYDPLAPRFTRTISMPANVDIRMQLVEREPKLIDAPEGHLSGSTPARIED